MLSIDYLWFDNNHSNLISINIVAYIFIMILYFWFMHFYSCVIQNKLIYVCAGACAYMNFYFPLSQRSLARKDEHVIPEEMVAILVIYFGKMHSVSIRVRIGWLSSRYYYLVKYRRCNTLKRILTLNLTPPSQLNI
jgi:hypothetical protein